jgi:hypothetical protein
MKKTGVVVSTCKHCGVEFSRPRCRVWRDKFCSRKCGDEFRKAAILSRKIECATCGAQFTPRPQQLRMGQGKFCSQKCNTAGRVALLAPASHAKGVATRRKLYAAGVLANKEGEERPRWKGGQEARIRRAIESGAMAARLRKYRAANPDKVSEWFNSRRAEKIGRIPRGTVKRLMEHQGGSCTYCGTKLPPYHLDHKLPVARGGRNDPGNLHLTCPRCNLRKSAMSHEEFLVSKKHPSRSRR